MGDYDDKSTRKVSVAQPDQPVLIWLQHIFLTNEVEKKYRNKMVRAFMVFSCNVKGVEDEL